MTFLFETTLQTEISLFWRQFSKEPGFVFLDSSDRHSEHSFCSILAFNPFLELSSDVNGVYLTWRNGRKECLKNVSVFDVLEHYISTYSCEKSDSFFPGGAIGFVGYDAIRNLPDFSFYSSQMSAMPEVWFGFYDVVIVVDEYHGRVVVQGGAYVKDSAQQFESVCQRLQVMHSSDLSLQQSDFIVKNHHVCCSESQFKDAIKTIQNYISQGDVYQVNFSYRHDVEYQGDLAELYANLRQQSPAPFSAFISTPTFSVLSSSPERFIKLVDRDVLTSPIKGTLPRLRDGLDLARQKNLLDSEKDAAELLMIVDLERNDLNTICKVGSVSVPCLKRLEAFEHVFHLVSDVAGVLQDGVSHVRAFAALFPGGSITGAPKIRATEIISELESVSRRIYTGCIGYFSFSGHSEFNIAIRSLYAYDQKLYFHTGCGIVADSDGDLEWKESQAKSKGILLALGLKEDF